VAEKVEVAGWSEWFSAPHGEKHGALEQKTIFVNGAAEAIKKPRDPVLNENELEVRAPIARDVQEALAHGCPQVEFRCRFHPSASR
jgi:hypothetical protein